MFLLLASFLAGVLTSLAPCMLTLLPVIVGGAILPGGDQTRDHKKPFVIAISLGLSVIVFTLLLKASTVLIGVDPKIWLYLSGSIVVLLGISMLFPSLWVEVSTRLGFEQGSNKLLARAGKHTGLGGQILTGAALGPVFSSCSPVYALILATILPINLALGLIYIVTYAIGLALALLTIAIVGRKLTFRLGWTANPDGWFRRVLAMVLILVGLAVITGLDKKFQVWALEHLPFSVTKLEEQLLPKSSPNSAPPSSKANQESLLSAKFNVDKPYPAPELAGIQEWINSNGESIKNLHGKVVLIDFWTYSCINCQRTLPHVTGWYEKYKDKGLVVLGLHAPEFAFEKVPENVKKAVQDDHINYPVGLDNNFDTWKAYKNQYWPAEYFIDRNGMVRHTHFGEGEYSESEAVIQALLAESGQVVSSKIDTTGDKAPVQPGQTPETYLGYERGERFANASQFAADQPVNYNLNSPLENGQWSLGGTWTIGPKQAVAGQSGATLRIKFSAKEVYLVMDGPVDKPVSLKLNGQSVTASQYGGSDVDAGGQLHLDGPRLYRLIKSPKFLREAELSITVPSGATVNAFTFGG